MDVQNDNKIETVSPIRTEEDYETALERIAELFHSEIGTPEGDELDVLVDMVELYEDKHYPMAFTAANDGLST